MFNNCKIVPAYRMKKSTEKIWTTSIFSIWIDWLHLFYVLQNFHSRLYVLQIVHSSLKIRALFEIQKIVDILIAMCWSSVVEPIKRTGKKSLHRQLVSMNCRFHLSRYVSFSCLHIQLWRLSWTIDIVGLFEGVPFMPTKTICSGVEPKGRLVIFCKCRKAAYKNIGWLAGSNNVILFLQMWNTKLWFVVHFFVSF